MTERLDALDLSRLLKSENGASGLEIYAKAAAGSGMTLGWAGRVAGSSVHRDDEDRWGLSVWVDHAGLADGATWLFLPLSAFERAEEQERTDNRERALVFRADNLTVKLFDPQGEEFGYSWPPRPGSNPA